MKVRPRPVRVPAARLRRPKTAAQTLWASRCNFGDLTDESVNPVLIKVKIKKKKQLNSQSLKNPHCRSRGSTDHTPLHHSKVHPPHAAGWRTKTCTKSKMAQ